MQTQETDVLVVGAGPTGLTMAIELVRRGVRVRLVDAAAEPATDTRALGMQARTLELFEKHGTVAALLARGLRAREFNIYSEDHRILQVRLSRLDTPYPFLLMIPQNETQAVLEAHLAGLGVTVERQAELVGLEQRNGGVVAEIRHAGGGSEHVLANRLVGCDGAHSTVRRLLGLNFLGDSFEEHFAVADLRMEWDLPPDTFYAFLNRGRFVAYFPMLHGWHRVAVAYPAERAPEGAVTIGELQAAVDVCAPRGAKIAEVRQSGRFHINQRRAERHSVGRVFLAGDAAHIHSVVGAQGMNTGIQDAFNLGWKLAAVLRGEAGPRLLDTYAAERAPVAGRLVTGTRRITRMTLLSGLATTAVRRNLAPLVLSRPHVRATIARAVSQIDISYHDGSGAGPEGRCAAGDRAPDVTMAHGRLYDLLDPVRHTVLAFGAAVGRLDDDELLSVVHVDDPAVRDRYGVRDKGLVLIRPDGYIGYRAAGEDAGALRAHLRRSLHQGRGDRV